MSDEPEKPRVVNLFDRREHVPEPERVNVPATSYDESSALLLANAYQQVIRGDLVGVCVIGLNPKTGEPCAWSMFPPGSLPRMEALRYMGLCDILKGHLHDVVIHGLQHLADIAEMADEDDAS